MSLIVDVGQVQLTVGIAADHRQSRLSEVAGDCPTVRPEIRLDFASFGIEHRVQFFDSAFQFFNSVLTRAIKLRTGRHGQIHAAEVTAR